MISVVIPTYNRQRTILRAVNSVLNQTYQDLEVIVVDDCSADDTRAVVEAIADPRVRYVCLEKNSGACTARNRGITLSRGEYIAFQDSDDEWYPNKLVKQLAALEENEADIVFCGFEKLYRDDMRWIHPQGLSAHFCSQEELLMTSLASTQTFLGKAEVIRDVMFDAFLPRMQDYDFIIRAAEKYRVYYLDQVLVTVYEQADSITAGKRSYQKRLDITGKLLDKYPALRKAYPRWEVSMLKITAHCLVMLKQDAAPVLKEIYKKEKSLANLGKLILYKLGLLYHIFDRADR